MTKAEEVKEFIKDIPGVCTIGKKEPLDDLVVYVHTKKAKQQVEKRLVGKNFGVSVEVAIFGKIAPIGPID